MNDFEEQKISLLKEQQKAYAASEKEASKQKLISFKQDARRTALQLSERIKVDDLRQPDPLQRNIAKNRTVNDIIKDADILYKWLIDVK